MKIYHVTERSYYYNDRDSFLISEYFNYDFISAMHEFRTLCENNLKRGCVPVSEVAHEMADKSFTRSIDCFPKKDMQAIFQNVHDCLYAVNIEAINVPNDFAFDADEAFDNDAFAPQHLEN